MKEDRDDKSKTVTLTFSSALEAHQWGSAETGMDVGQYDYDNHYSRVPGKVGDEWSGTKDFPESMELAGKGWESGTAAILDMVKQIETKDDLIQRGYDWDVTGDFFDVGEVIQGTPECWLTPAFEPAPRVISICVNVSQSASVKGKQIINRGAALLALIDRLQDTQEIIVDLTIYYGIGYININGWENGQGTLNIMFPVGTSPLPMQEVGFMLAHPSMIRRGCFSAAERVSGYNMPSGYGSVIDLPEEKQKEYSLYLGSSPRSNGLEDCDTVKGAVRWIHNQMAKMEL